MNIDPTPVYGARAADGNSTKTDESQKTNEMFLQLLMTQLKNQSPLEPMNPTEFVGQLVQFNTLNELIQIRQMLQKVSTVSKS